MALYQKAKIVFCLKDTEVKLSGNRYEGIATVQIVECSPANSMLLVIPTVPEGATVPEDTVIVDMVSITDRAQLKPDQVACAVEISEAPPKGVAAHTPGYALTVQLQQPIVFWEFMTVYTNAMLKYGNFQVAIDDLVTELINEDEDEDEADESSEEHRLATEVEEVNDKAGILSA